MACKCVGLASIDSDSIDVYNFENANWETFLTYSYRNRMEISRLPGNFESPFSLKVLGVHVT